MRTGHIMPTDVGRTQVYSDWMKQTILGVALVLVAFLSVSSSQAASDKRSYTSANFALDLDNFKSGILQKVEGGDIEGAVVTVPGQGESYPTKHLGPVKYQDLQIQAGAGMSAGFWEWIEASLTLKHTRKDGAVVAADYNDMEVSRLEFFHALITEIGFPALDGSSKDPAPITVKIHPELIKMKSPWDYVKPQPSGQPIQSQEELRLLADQAVFPRYDIPNSRAPSLTKQAFRLRIKGIEVATNAALTIEPVVVTTQVVENQVGESRDITPSIGPTNVSDLVFVVPVLASKPLYDWYNDFVIKGDSQQEKTGTLELLSADGRQVLFTLHLSGLGIHQLGPVEDGETKNLKRVRAAVYVESVQLEVGKGAIAQATQKASTASRGIASVKGNVKSGNFLTTP